MRFFKRIRRRLIVSKKQKEYLAYAVGEIVLVVIGILIALAIDTGMENRAIRAQEREYLTGLREEFRVSRRKLEELIRVNRRNTEGAAVLVAYVAAGEDRPNERELSELLYATFASDVVFNPNNSLLTEIINSGSLQVLSETRLRLRLTNWLATLQDVAKQEEELYTQREKMLDMLRDGAYSIRTIMDLAGAGEGVENAPAGGAPASNLALIESRVFENNLLMFMHTCQATETNHYLPLLEDLDEILSLLDK